MNPLHLHNIVQPLEDMLKSYDFRNDLSKGPRTYDATRTASFTWEEFRVDYKVQVFKDKGFWVWAEAEISLEVHVYENERERWHFPYEDEIKEKTAKQFLQIIVDTYIKPQIHAINREKTAKKLLRELAS